MALLQRRRWLGLVTAVSLAILNTRGAAFTLPSTRSMVLQHERRTTKPAFRNGHRGSDGAVVSSTADAQLEQEPDAKKSLTYMDDGFVFGLEGSGLERPKGKVPVLVLEGETMETEPHHVVIVTATLLAHVWFGTHALQQLELQQGNLLVTGVEAFVVGTAAWVLADFVSGVIHWAMDNYGNGRTPVLGKLIGAFQGHHLAPWTITQREFCNNAHKLCFFFGIPTIVFVDTLFGTHANNPLVTVFFTTFLLFAVLTQEIHKWAHQTPSESEPWMNWLQDLGVALPRTMHARHHTEPFEFNYCITSGVCNEALDRSGFFRWMEHVIYNWNGVESNAWKLDADLKERTLSGDYSLPSVS